MANKKKISKEEEEKQKLLRKIEEEKLKILSDADKVKGEQLHISDQGKVISKKELKEYALGDIDNPERKYDIYYRGISKLLLKYLPRGREYKKARDYIYEEKNVYLTRGKRINRQGIRGADGRMGYIVDAETILKTVMDWILENDGMSELFNIIRDLNIKKGYGVREF